MMLIAPVTMFTFRSPGRPTRGRAWFAGYATPYVVPSGFSEVAITRVWPPEQYGTQLHLSWQSVAPAGTTYQIYIDRHLIWHGTSLDAYVPTPTTLVSRIDIGTVGAGQGQIDFSGSLPGAPNRLVQLSWLGGSYEDPDIAGFHVYQSPAAGFPIDYTKIVGTVTAYTAGVITDGYGYGGYGEGGYGESAASYTWLSGTLTSGAWSFGVRPYDLAGNEGPSTETTVTLCLPPNEPGLCFADGRRLHDTYDFPSKEVTLYWCASPG
jgi:hypothetical protein